MFDKIRKAFGGSEKPKAETKQKIESAPEVEETAAPVAETKKETRTGVIKDFPSEFSLAGT